MTLRIRLDLVLGERRLYTDLVQRHIRKIVEVSLDGENGVLENEKRVGESILGSHCTPRITSSVGKRMPRTRVVSYSLRRRLPESRVNYQSNISQNSNWSALTIVPLPETPIERYNSLT